MSQNSPELTKSVGYFLKHPSIDSVMLQPKPSIGIGVLQAKIDQMGIKFIRYGTGRDEIVITHISDLAQPGIAVAGYSWGKEQPNLFLIGLTQDGEAVNGHVLRGSFPLPAVQDRSLYVYCSRYPLSPGGRLEGQAAIALFRYSTEQLSVANSQALQTVFDAHNYNPPEEIRRVLGNHSR